MAAEPTETEAVVESVTAGDYDGHLHEILDAIRLRLQFGTTAFKWSLSYDHDGETYEVKETDISLGEARLVEKLTGNDWGMLNPTASADECVSIIAACLHSRHGQTLKFTVAGPSGDAWDAATSIPAEAAVQAITGFEVERPPKS